jgi:hypothetical protein
VGRARPLAAGGLAATAAACAAALTLSWERTVLSCFPAATTGPFTNAVDPTAECPAFALPGYVGHTLVYTLCSTLVAVVLVLPPVVGLGRRVASAAVRPGARAGTRRTARVRARLATAALCACGVAFVATVGVGAATVVDRSADAARGTLPGSIGVEGYVTGPEFSVRLIRGWVDVSDVPEARRRFGDSTVGVLLDTDGSGALVVAQSDARVVDRVLDDPELRPAPAPPIDGERAVEFTEPGRDGSVHLQVATEHDGSGYVLELLTAPGDMAAADVASVRRMLRTWEWP